jgi:hypothetical protein
MPRTARRRPVFGVIAAAVLLGLSACTTAQGDRVASAGGGGSAPTSTRTGNPAAQDPDAQALVFAQCMRDNGVDMPDPGPGQQGMSEAFQSVAGKYDQRTMQRALSACQNLMPQYAAEQQHSDDIMLELAECLREQGFDVSDDPFDDAHQGKIDVGEFSAAMEVCRDVLIRGGR